MPVLHLQLPIIVNEKPTVNILHKRTERQLAKSTVMRYTVRSWTRVIVKFLLSWHTLLCTSQNSVKVRSTALPLPSLATINRALSSLCSSMHLHVSVDSQN